MLRQPAMASKKRARQKSRTLERMLKKSSVFVFAFFVYTQILPAADLDSLVLLELLENPGFSSRLSQEYDWEPIPAIPPDDPWYIKYKQDYDYCTNNNYVIDRYLKGGAQVPQQIGNPDAARVFSLQPEAFLRHHPTDCTSVEDILAAIQNGSRKWINQTIAQLPGEPDDNMIIKE
eukprot:scaffold11046_cov183-Amphora_coffeaeformis.AAC.23